MYFTSRQTSANHLELIGYFCYKLEQKKLYLYIFFLVVVNVLCKLCVLESMDSGNDQQDGWESLRNHLSEESETE